jgi:GTPase SAR1 family protein
VDVDRNDILYCFKLFGSINKQYKEKGYMILTNSDRRYATLRIIKLYNVIKDIIMSSNIIYLGYSFIDDIVFDILKDIKNNTDKSIMNGYAIMPHKPSEHILKLFTQFNIEWVQGDVETFTKELKTEFSEIPKSFSLARKSLSFENIGFEISRQTLINIRDHIDFLHDESFLSISDNPKYFFEGKDKTYYPFVKQWDIDRNIELVKSNNIEVIKMPINSEAYITNRQSKQHFKDNIKNVLMGTAGSGKTIVTKRIAYEWYRRGHPVFFIEPKGYRLDKKVIEGFLDEILILYNKRISESGNLEKIHNLRFLMIADNKTENLEDIIEIFDYLSTKEICVDLLVVDRINNIYNKLKTINFDAVYKIENTLTVNDLKLFCEHIDKIHLDISKEILYMNIRDVRINESFFALMYTTIKEAQKPLKEIILDEYNSLNTKEKEIYGLISVLDSLNINLYINLLCKYNGIGVKWLKNEIVTGKFSGILRIQNDHIYTNHQIISEIIDQNEFYTPSKYYDVFNIIVNTFTPGNYTEEELIHNILIKKLHSESLDVRVSPERTIGLYNKVLKKIETRPLYHHLAMYYLKNKEAKLAEITIKKAYKIRGGSFFEPDRNLQDTEGRIELLKIEKMIDNNDIGEAIWSSLDKAENLFFLAQNDVRASPHPFQGMALTYYYYALINVDDNKKNNYCLLALSKINYINKNSPESQIYNFSTTSKILKELGDDFDENSAQKILDSFNNPDGYAYLAEKSIEKNKPINDTLELIEKGLRYQKSVWLLRLKAEIYCNIYGEDINKIDEIMNDYINLNIYDLFLAFELAKYYFKIFDYKKSFITFDDLKNKSFGYKEGFEFKEKNILYVGNKMKEFKGIIKKSPTIIHYGLITTDDISKEFDEIKVRYDDIKYEHWKSNDKVYFNIFFTFEGPQAMNVTIR